MPTMNEEWSTLEYDPESSYGGGFRGDYDDIVNSWGYETLVFATHGDYQGDYFYLLRHGEEFGFLNVGYGSCSGCDALQGCDSRNEVEELRAGLHDSIHWESDKARMALYLVSHDWPGSYYGEAEDVQKFINDCLAIVGLPEFSSTTVSLLKNPESPADIIADSVEDYGYSKLAELIRKDYSQESTLKRLRRLVCGE